MLKRLIITVLISSMFVIQNSCMNQTSSSNSSYQNAKMCGVNLVACLCEQDFKDAQYWLDQGADANYYNNFGENALIALCNNDYQNNEFEALEFLKKLIENGAILDDKNSWGITPLMCTLMHNSVQIATYLIEMGADINARDKEERTCLFYAIDQNLYQLILNKGANINAKDKEGKTCLMMMACIGTLNDVKFFLEKGADISARDNFGHDIIFYAEQNQNRRVAQFIRAQLNQTNGADNQKRKLIGTTKSNIAAKRHKEDEETLPRIIDSTSLPEVSTPKRSLPADALIDNVGSDASELKQIKLLQAQKEYCSSQCKQATDTYPAPGFNPRLRLYNPANDVGARCFIHAIFQCLFHLPHFTQLVIDQISHYQNKSLAESYAKAVKTLINFPNDKRTEFPNFCIKVWKALHHPIGTHQDASEFLNHLLDRLLDEDLCQEIKSNLPCYESTRTPITDISKLFYSTVQSKITSADNLVSAVKEYYTMLNIPISNDCSSLEDCLKLYFAKEKLEQNDPDQPVKEKQLSLLQPAPYMIMRLKRDEFSIDNSNGATRYITKKNNAVIKFPLKLTLVHKDNEIEEETESQYKLLSFIAHKGTSQIGHYVAFVNINDEWYLFNDDNMPVLMSPEEIWSIGEHGYFGEEDANPAIFFYGKE